MNNDDAHFLSILPLGLKHTFDIEGWVISVPPKSDATVERMLDYEIKSDTLELLCSQYDKLQATFPDETKYIGTDFPLLVFQIKNVRAWVQV